MNAAGTAIRRVGQSCMLLLALLVACAVLTTARPAVGGQGFTLALPLPPQRPVAGLSLLFDCTWADGGGYLPIRLTVNCAAPAAVDRRLAIEITNRTFGERQPIVVTSGVDLPAGSTRVTKVIAFPRCSLNYNLSLNVWENGVYLEDLSFENRSMFSTGIGQRSAPATLFVTSGQPDVSAFEFATNGASSGTVTTIINGVPVTQPASAVGSIAQFAPFTSLPAAELFDDWILYSGLDVIFIAQADIESLASGRSKALKALRDWTVAGGNLCVFGVGADWRGLEALEARLVIPVEPDDVDQPLRGWREPAPEIYTMPLAQPGGAIVVREDADVDGPAKTPRRKAPDSSFVWKKAGLGMVVGINDANPFPGDAAEWRWLFNTIGPDRWRWEGRHGVLIADGNPSFDDFTIADVGLPPVKAYRVLITLFVVGIGPLNYWLLRRKRRLHLLLFTVPAAALTVSLALVAYAVIGDGFDTYLRARSYTELDQRRGEAVSWARLSYYAGLAPSGGLAFGADTALLPIDRDSYYQRSVHALRQTDWTPEQYLVRGWVPARTPKQYLTMRPYACQRELRVLESAGTTGCSVENRLDTKIKFLMLRSASGDLYSARDVERGGRATLAALDTEAKAQRATLDMLNQRSEAALVKAAAAPTPVSRMFFSRPYRFQRGGDYFVQDSSLLEAGISRAFEEIGSQLPEPRTYVAIVERPPDVTAGLEDLVERQSFHVILGTW